LSVTIDIILKLKLSIGLDSLDAQDSENKMPWQVVIYKTVKIENNKKYFEYFLYKFLKIETRKYYLKPKCQ